MTDHDRESALKHCHDNGSTGGHMGTETHYPGKGPKGFYWIGRNEEIHK